MKGTEMWKRRGGKEKKTKQSVNWKSFGKKEEGLDGGWWMVDRMTGNRQKIISRRPNRSFTAWGTSAWQRGEDEEEGRGD
jgi:hypothetical protein